MISTISPNRRRLIRLMQTMNHGTIENLAIRNREPVFKPRPRAMLTIKLAAKNDPRPESDLDDFVFKKEIVELFALFDQIQDGMIALIKVQHGLPAIVERPLRLGFDE